MTTVAGCLLMTDGAYVLFVVAVMYSIHAFSDIKTLDRWICYHGKFVNIIVGCWEFVLNFSSDTLSG